MARGGSEVLAQLKGRRAELGLKKQLRVMGSSCLGACESGITALVVGPEGSTFYGRLDSASADALIDECVLAGAPGPELRRHRLPSSNLLDLSALEEAPQQTPPQTFRGRAGVDGEGDTSGVNGTDQGGEPT